MNAPEKDLGYFLARFNNLADDARDHGLSVVILIENVDPIKREASTSKIVRGTRVTEVGLLRLALMDYMPPGS